MSKSCGTCIMADWTGNTTPTGRFKRDAASRCEYPIPIPVLPASVPRRDRERSPYRKVAVTPSCGSDCPVHVPLRGLA